MKMTVRISWVFLPISSGPTLIRLFAEEITCHLKHLKSLSIQRAVSRKKKMKSLYWSLCFIKCVYAQIDSENMAILQCYDCLLVCYY